MVFLGVQFSHTFDFVYMREFGYYILHVDTNEIVVKLLKVMEH